MRSGEWKAGHRMIEIDLTRSFRGSMNRYRQHNSDERERRDHILKPRAQEI